MKKLAAAMLALENQQQGLAASLLLQAKARELRLELIKRWIL